MHSTLLRRSPVAVALALTFAVASMTANATSPKWHDSAVRGNPASWETPEYQKDWGLTVMNASDAYARGYTGQGVQLGVMDSGVLKEHREFSDGRITVTKVEGEYGTTGNRYPQAVKEGDVGLPYTKGEKFKLTGDFVKGLNDSHGTHCTGTIAAARDGREMHGVAFNARVVVGNTGATDNNNYGPFQDYQYFYTGWKALVDAGARIINNSWGTNTRVFERYDINPDGTIVMKDGKPVVNTSKYKDHLATDTEAQIEYEYMLFKKRYGGEPDFVDAARDAITGHDTVQVFTTGNRDFAHPFYRPLYPYFNPAIESQWLAVAGLEQYWEYVKDQDGKDLKVELKDQKGNGIGTKANVTEREAGRYRLVSNWNEAGEAKWWTVTAPGKFVYSTIAEKDHGGKFVFPDKADGYSNPNHVTHNTGYLSETPTDDYGIKSGTSMAAPHATGALGVILSRYPNMTASQARDVMLTTARHDGMEGWTNTDGTEPAPGEVSDRMGWGVPDLKAAMEGPRQFLGRFVYRLEGTDVWNNDISQVALDQRRREEKAWMKKTENGTKLDAYPYELGAGALVKDGDTDMTNHLIDLEDAKKWRAEFFKTRADAIKARIYDGSLVKAGNGTLTMTGTNTYRGGTTVEAGRLIAYPQSLGLGAVTVKKGAVLEILAGDRAKKADFKVLVEKGGKVVLHDAAYNFHVNAEAGAEVTVVK